MKFCSHPSNWTQMASISLESAAASETDGSIQIRRLELADHERGFVSLLSQLSSCPGLTASEFAARFTELAVHGDDHVILVAEDPSAQERRILTTGCLFVERKFLRGGGKVGHVEDVVVDALARGRGLAIRIVRRLVEMAGRPAATRSSSTARRSCARTTPSAGLWRRGFRWLSTSDPEMHF